MEMYIVLFAIIVSVTIVLLVLRAMDKRLDEKIAYNNDCVIEWINNRITLVEKKD